MPSGYWDDVIGHQTVVRLLGIWADQPAFSYLFHGQTHLGKNFLAEKFIRNMVGAQPDQDLRLHPDVVTFLPEEGKKEVSVEQVRDLRVRLYEKPQLSKRMVGYLPKLDRLNEAGLSALLKIMEEPPQGTVFVSVAENVNRIPATIISRTVLVPMGLVPTEAIVSSLKKRGVDESLAREMAIASRGRPGLALQPKPEDNDLRKAAQSYAQGPAAGDRIAAADEMRRACESSEEPAEAWSEALEDCHEAIRQLMLEGRKEAVALAQGVADAHAAINSPIQPHIMLDAAALQVQAGKTPLPDLYPRYFPLSLNS